MSTRRVTAGLVVGLVGLLWMAGCSADRASRLQSSVSLVFSGYTNEGQSAIFLLTDSTGSIQQYHGPYVEIWDGTAWKDYSPAKTVLAEASKHMTRHETVTVPVPPGGLHWRAYVSCVVFGQRLQGHVLVRSDVIQDAARSGDLKKVRGLLKKNPDLVFSTTSNGDTALHLAAFSGSRGVAKLLLARKAAVDAKDSAGWTPLFMAVFYNHKNVAKLLLANKADVNARNDKGEVPLYWAAFTGTKEMAELLLEDRVDVNAKAKNGNTPLHMATIVWGRKQVPELLVAHKANVNARNSDGETPLHKAADSGNKEIIELLLDKKADVNAKANNGDTPLHVAVLHGHKEVAELLRQRGGRE